MLQHVRPCQIQVGHEHTLRSSLLLVWVSQFVSQLQSHSEGKVYFGWNLWADLDVIFKIWENVIFLHCGYILSMSSLFLIGGLSTSTDSVVPSNSEPSTLIFTIPNTSGSRRSIDSLMLHTKNQQMNFLEPLTVTTVTTVHFQLLNARLSLPWCMKAELNKCFSRRALHCVDP